MEGAKLRPQVDGIDAKDLQLSLWSGKLELKDVKVGSLGLGGNWGDDQTGLTGWFNNVQY